MAAPSHGRAVHQLRQAEVRVANFEAHQLPIDPGSRANRNLESSVRAV